MPSHFSNRSYPLRSRVASCVASCGWVTDCYGCDWYAAAKWLMVPLMEYKSSAGKHNTWRDAAVIGTHLVDTVAIVVQRFIGMAMQGVSERSEPWALGAEAL